MKKFLYTLLLITCLSSACGQTYPASEGEAFTAQTTVPAQEPSGTQQEEVMADPDAAGEPNLDARTISDTYTGTSFTEDELAELDFYINNEIENGFPGAVLLIMEKGEIVKNTAYGNALIYDGLETLDTPQPMTTDTLFDLASLTKAFATTFAIMKLENEGLLSTSDYVSQYLEGFDTEDKASITIDHLLTHTSGFASTHRFFDPDNEFEEEGYSLDRDRTMSLLPSMPLKYPTGTDSLYSDLGFITLGAIVESITGTTLDTYVEENIYEELNLTHTLYKPLEKSIPKNTIAATERVGNTREYKYEWPEVRTYTLQGEVHDELAYYAMNGVSGNAGLFSNAYDLASLSQMLLNGGSYVDQIIFSQTTVEKFTMPSEENGRYCLGFDYGGAEDNYRRYSMLASDKAYGKTGWTGTDVLIDSAYDLVVVLLTNKRHSPYAKGNFLGADYQTGQYSPIITQIYEMLLDTKSYDYGYEDQMSLEANDKTDIVLGIDRIGDYADFFEDKKVGLITNNSGKTSTGESSIDVLYNHTDLVALYSPEHGIEGKLEGGERYGSTTDAVTDLPIYSLYGETLKPTDQMLKDLDVMAFDIQDVGARFYTYIYTMLNAMEACAENDIEFLVFDRPNPLGGVVEGNLIEDRYTSFVGMYGLPIRHGLTVGELAMYVNETYKIGCDLTVIPLEMVGAPFINPYEFVEVLNSYDLEGVSFIPTSFMPDASKFADELCYGVRIRVDDKEAFKSVDMGLSLLYALKELYEDDFEMKEGLNYLAGTDLIALLEDEEMTREAIIDSFTVPEAFIDESKSFHLYEEKKYE